MPERYLPLERFGRGVVRDPWVLVLGGVTSEGNRRARQAAQAASAAQFDVVWLDGFEETHDDQPDAGRVPLDEETRSEVVIVGYGEQDRGLFTNRMLDVVPGAIEMPVNAVARSMKGLQWAARAAKRLEDAMGRIVAWLRKRVLLRVAVFMRGYLGWRAVRKRVKPALIQGPPPAQIIYGDDYALTQAWHLCRMWPDVRVAMEFQPR